MWKKTDEDDMNTNSQTTKVNSSISPKSVVVGEVKGNEDLVILGTLDGIVNLNKNHVTVGKTGYVKGTVNSQAIMVEGKVEGDLKATSRVILRSSAKVKGNIITGSLVMEDGCFFQGTIDMMSESAKPINTTKPNVKPAEVIK